MALMPAREGAVPAGSPGKATHAHCMVSATTRAESCTETRMSGETETRMLARGSIAAGISGGWVGMIPCAPPVSPTEAKATEGMIPAPCRA